MTALDRHLANCGYTSVARIHATFRPHRTDDLNPDALSRVGERLEFSYSGEGEDGRRQWRTNVISGWLPESDLQAIEPVEPSTEPARDGAHSPK